MQDSLDLRENRTEHIRANEVQDRVNFLLWLGFSSDVVSRMKNHRPTLYHKELIWEKIEALRALGFSDPIKLIASLPTILGLSVEGSIKPKLQALHILGFSNPIKLVTTLPIILGLSIEEGVKLKLQALQNLWFSDPIKLVTSLPATLGYSVDDNIQPKINALRSLWFSDPARLIMSLPTILNLSIEDTIEPKIDHLRSLWFSDPVKLITSSPSILWYSIKDNIWPKIKILDTLVPDKDLSRELIYQAPAILGTKIDKTWTILRWLSELHLLIPEVVTQYKHINMCELESFVLAVRELKNNNEFLILPVGLKIKKLLSTIAHIKKSWDKKNRSNKVLQVSDKIGSRYARGYKS